MDFSHLRKHLAKKVYSPIAKWKPTSWQGDRPPPAIHVQRLDERNLDFNKAVVNPRIPQVPNRREGGPTAKDLERRHERNLLLAIIGGVVGWENVPGSDGKDMPFPGVSQDPTHAGVRAIRALLRVLGPEEERSFIQFVNDDVNWLTDDEEPEAGGDALPLEKPSTNG